MKKIFILLLLPFYLTGQTVTLNSGIINLYTPVTLIDTSLCPSRITVGSGNGFFGGDDVLIIQMKGAKFDTSNTAAFGSLINLQAAGAYEIAKVAAVSGNVIKLNGALLNKYSVSGKVQLIKIPKYNHVNVNGVLYAQPWNGSTGGVLIMEASHIHLNANIDVSAQGFRGGTTSMNHDGNCGAGSPGYHYQLMQGGVTWIQGGAEKGEGIGEIDTARLAGRGNLVNGGGGGNKHNTGGGGGSNYAAGGKGGDGLQGCNHSTGGLGGVSLSSHYNNKRIFLGGGGGCGDANDQVGSDGVAGGGIVIIKTQTLTANNFSIKANGGDVTVVGSGIADGAGGGGAGGSVFLQATTLIGNVNLEAEGGDGGDQSPTYGCVGTGGGGGAGAILVSLPTSTNMSPLLSGGQAGIVFNTSFSCDNTSYGATAGLSNTVGILTGKELVMTPDSVFSCKPVGLKNISLNNQLSVFPDPVTEELHFRLSELSMRPVSLSVLDGMGKIIFYTNDAELLQNAKINVSDLPAGVYLLQLTAKEGQSHCRFIKN